MALARDAMLPVEWRCPTPLLLVLLLLLLLLLPLLFLLVMLLRLDALGGRRKDSSCARPAVVLPPCGLPPSLELLPSPLRIEITELWQLCPEETDALRAY